ADMRRLISGDRSPPLLQIVAFNRPVVTVVAHRIVLQRSDPISELVNMHNCEERSDEAIQLRAARRATKNAEPAANAALFSLRASRALDCFAALAMTWWSGA